VAGAPQASASSAPGRDHSTVPSIAGLSGCGCIQKGVTVSPNESPYSYGTSASLIMSPNRVSQITILKGAGAGRVIPLDSNAFRIGRQVSNDLELADVSVSRFHCLIETIEDSQHSDFRIRDLESANGIKVNGHSVAETELHSGDRIQVGDYVLLFDEHEPAFSDPDPGACLESTFHFGAAEVLRIQSAAGQLPETDRYGDDLRILLEISTECNRLHQVPEIQETFLAKLLARIPAEYAAAIPLNKPDLGSCIRYRSHVAPSPENLGLGISRTLIERVRRNRDAIVVNSTQSELDLSRIKSFVKSRAESVMVIPTLSGANLTGIVYLASSCANAFDEYHLRLSTAAASILGSALERAFESETIEEENARLLSEIRIRHRLLGVSAEISKVLNAIQRVCVTDTTVLILGESGTGKELAARAIHDNSTRQSRSMVAFNCASFTETLIESELFGHERGAFSGAHNLKRGVFEQAQNGSLFLDEIGELNLASQAKLLRVLEEREVVRVGGEKPVKVDFRLIAATHRGLKEATQKGQFRQDLYYRLNVFSFAMPALRERRQDILLLAGHFLEEFRRKTLRHINGFSTSASDYLLRYDWPGNVRELRNAVERAVIAGASSYIEVEDLPDNLSFTETTGTASSLPPSSIPYKDALLEARRRIILNAFRSAGGKHTKAAELLGVHPNNLHRMLKELGIRDEARSTQI
jgi:two-component system, NtrC family, response regulator HydG